MAELDLEQLTRLTLELVAMPSVTGAENAIADLVDRRCRAMPGVRLERIGNAVVARCGPDRPGAVALVGHLDTVPPWPLHRATRSRRRVTGRGAADMKGGVAAQLAVLEYAARRQLPLVAVFYDREEGPHELNGIHKVLATSALLARPAFAFVLEPTANQVMAGCTASLRAEVVFEGRSGHAARPWEADSAILKAAPFIRRAADLAARPVEVEGLTFFDTMAITSAHAGIAPNVVPDRFELGLDVRHAPGRDPDEVRAWVEGLCGPEARVAWIGESPAAMPALGNPVLADFIRRTGAAVVPKQAWTDVATLSAHGIPAANFGPGDPAQAHQTGEHVDCGEVQRCARVLADFVQERVAAIR